MRDREERHKEIRTSEERNQNRERHKRGMERLNLGKNGTGRREKQYELDWKYNLDEEDWDEFENHDRDYH